MLSKVVYLAFLIAVLYPSYVASLWPIPRQLQTGTTALRLSNSFTIDLTFRNAPEDLKQAVSRTQAQIKNDKLERLVVGRGAEDRERIQRAKELRKLRVSLEDGATIKSIAEETALEVGQRDEGYSLTIPADGTDAVLKAKTTLGLFRGLTTFTQIWYTLDRFTYTVEAPFTIVDSPAFPYRGFMLDTARNFFPVDDIKRTLDAMSWVKINSLHWHIVDAQSFPLEIEEFPELAQAGAYSSSAKYSPRDFKEIISYAAARGIDVLLEIDTPGHTSIIHKSHPEYVACFEASPWTTYAYEPPAGQLRLAHDEVVDFTSRLFTAVLKHLPGKFFSSGGDEINKQCYAEDPATQEQLAAKGLDLEGALNVFTQKTHKAIIDSGKTPVVWQEMVLAHSVTLAPETVAMVWISSADAKAVAAKGHRLIHAASDYFYLDCGGGGWIGRNPNGNSWCDPFKTWQKAYSFDPYASLSAEESKLVLGGQQLLWTEQTDPSNLDPIAWPRAASSAEVFWTGTTHPNGLPRNGTEALPRLHDLRFRLVQRGVKAIALQPLWCALRPNACDL